MNAAEWNARYPVGQAVAVTQDDGSVRISRTRTEAWDIEVAVRRGTKTMTLVSYEGRAGGYHLDRVRPIDETEGATPHVNPALTQ